MGGSGAAAAMAIADEDGWEFPPPPPPCTLVLVGCTGNGKSATGNSILGRRAFKSGPCSTSVTETSQLESAVLPDGRTISIVDTPGLFDQKTPFDFVGKEILRCIEFAKEGVHAFLLVLSSRSRFTDVELAAIEGLRALFGPQIAKYMIVVFTGGDELEEHDMHNVKDYLGAGISSSLSEILKECNNRALVFDNKTKDQYKKNRQVSELLRLVEQLLAENEWQPYSNDLFQGAKDRAEAAKGEELKLAQGSPFEEITKLREEMGKAHAEQLRLVISMLEEKLRLHTEQLEERLDKEKLAREEVERYAQEVKKKSEADMQLLQEQLEKANKQRQELEERLSNAVSCTIL